MKIFDKHKDKSITGVSQVNIPSAETRSADADVTCCCFLCAAEPEAGAESELLSDHFLFYDLHGCVCTIINIQSAN